MTTSHLQPLRYVHIEDTEADAALVQRTLRAGGYEPCALRVETADGLAAALREPGWDLILADWALPQFSAPTALAQIARLDITQDLPVIIVSGTVGEAVAVEALQAGAHDYVMKDRLIRLVPAVQRALREVGERKARRQVESRLRRTQYAIDHATEYIFVIGSDGYFLDVNESACRRLGYTKQELLTQSVMDIDPDFSPAAWKACWDDFKEKKVSCFETRHRSKSGEIYPVEIVASYIVHDGQELDYVFVRDITERKQAEASLQAFQQQIRQMQKMEAIGQLAGGVAHDFNNILTAILGNAEMAVAKLASDHPARTNLARIQAAGERASQLVQQILAFSHQQERSRTVVALAPVVHEVLTLLRATLPAGIELTYRTDAGTPPVLADATELHQVLMNLCTNAWHAVGDHSGSITVDLAPVTLTEPLLGCHATLPPGSYVRLSVRDTGCGMDPDTVERIFDPFFTTKPVGQGTGLGLSVVHGIVQGHDGAIIVHSQPGQGTTFHLHFPAVDAPAQASEQAEAMAVQVQGRSRHLLYLDDEAMLVELVCAKLELLGYRVTGSMKAAEALAAIRADPAGFDAVVTDYNMPGLSGLDVARAVSQIRTDLPVVLVSGYLSPTAQAAALATGIKEIVAKPTLLQQLGDVVARVLNSPPQG